MGFSVFSSFQVSSRFQVFGLSVFRVCGLGPVRGQGTPLLTPLGYGHHGSLLSGQFLISAGICLTTVRQRVLDDGPWSGRPRAVVRLRPLRCWTKQEKHQFADFAESMEGSRLPLPLRSPQRAAPRRSPPLPPHRSHNQKAPLGKKSASQQD